MSAPPFPLWAWLVFGGIVLALLFLDLFVLHRNAREVPFKEALWLSGFWIAISLAFGGFVWFLAGVGGAEAYLAAYLLEKSLSVDNLSVFSVIFTSFAVPERDRYHVLFYGVIGAIVFRAIFVLAGAALLAAFAWLVFVFGAFLIFTGLRMLRRASAEGEQTDYQNNRILRLFRRFIPITKEYHGDKFFVKRDDGKRCATPLLAALMVVESSDIIFAIDSVPAVLAVTQTAFVAYSSIVFAVLGLRALYFALEGLVDRFVYLHYGLAVILVFVGTKFVAQGFGLHIPIVTSLLVILVAIVASMAVSLGATRGGNSHGGDDHPQRER
jgi:tellurite resistance protein TerC